MDIQANLAYHKGELDRAIRLFQLVTQRMVHHQGVQVTDNSVVEISIKLSQIFAMKGLMNECLSGLEFCVETQRDKVVILRNERDNEVSKIMTFLICTQITKGDKDEDTLMLAAWSLQNLAQLYMSSATEGQSLDKGAVSKAAELAREAHNYASEAVGADSQQVCGYLSETTDLS